jgi:hypothetical protein
MLFQLLTCLIVLCRGYLLDGSPAYGQKVVFTACLELGIPLFLFALVALLSAHINCYGVRTILLNTYKGLWPLAHAQATHALLDALLILDALLKMLYLRPLASRSHPQAEEEMRTLQRFVIEQIEPCIERDKHVNPPMQCWTPAQRRRYYRTSGIGGTPFACFTSTKVRILTETVLRRPLRARDNI